MSCRSKQQYHVKLNIKLSHIRAKNQINSIIFDFTFYRWSESVLKYQAFVLQVYYLFLIALSRFHMPVCHLLFTLIFSYLTPLFKLLNKIIITIKLKAIQNLLSLYDNYFSSNSNKNQTFVWLFIEVLALSLAETHCEVHHTDLASNSNISKTVRVNIAIIKKTFLKSIW